MNQTALLALCVSAPMLIGVLNGIATAKSIREWYPTLNKPPWTPPNWLFAPVWTALYLMMGTALFLISRQGLDTPGVRVALALFVLQLALNAAWSPVFFGRRNVHGALKVLLAMDVTVIATIVAFWPLSSIAALLLVPYLAWGLFATGLNISIVQRNPRAS